MEEQLNMIFEKILDIERQLKSQMIMQEQKKIENIIKENQCHLEDIKYRAERFKEERAEEMAIFRSAGKQKQVED